MISAEPMNPGIATECKFVSATDVRRTSQLLVELAPLPRGSGASGVSNLRAPGSRIMEEEENLSRISSYLFSARLCRQRGGESDLEPLWLGHLDGKMRQDGGAIEKWNRPERGSATVGIASFWQPFIAPRPQAKIVMTSSALDD